MEELNKNWEKELDIRNEILNKNAFDLTGSDKSFLNFVKLKETFHQEALDMVDWINKEIEGERTLFESYLYFMDNGFMNYQPDRYDYRTAVFNDIKEAIQNDEPYNIYDIVYKWDMWYHS
tara:strand:+ start:29 stop:388 length:360 start_codon:yes stop_codon:yes gene_type:complete